CSGRSLLLSAMTTGSRAASHATSERFRNASLNGGLGARRMTTWSTLAASVFSRHWSERKRRFLRVPSRSIDPCADPVRRTSTKSPQVASCFLPLRVQTIWRLSASSTRNSRPKSAMTRPSTTTCCSRSRRVVILEVEQRVQLRGADEVVLGQPVDGVRDVRDLALAPAHQHVRVVVLAVRDPGRGVHERHGLEVGLELVGLRDRLAVARPALQSLQHRAHLLVGQRRDTALAGNALLARELVHDALRRWSIRRAAGGCESYTSECSGSGVSVAALSR